MCATRAAITENIFRRILKDSEFSLPGEDIELDLDCILNVFQQEVVPKLSGAPENLKFDLLESIFYRGKAAYMVGRVIDGEQTFPYGAGDS